MKYETLQTLSQVSILIGALLVAFGTFGAWYFGKLAQRTPISRDDVNDVVAKQLANLGSRLNTHQPPVNERYPGLAIHMLVQFNDLAEPRRKYLLDIGNPTTSRLSVYLDASNVFTFSLIDVHGEPHVTRVPQGPTGIPVHQYIYLACELGIRPNSTILRVLVDGNEVVSQDMPFKVDPGSFKLPGSVLGADLDGKNGGAFQLKELILRTQTSTTADTKLFLDYFSAQVGGSSLLFAGTQWMRMSENGKTP